MKQKNVNIARIFLICCAAMLALPAMALGETNTDNVRFETVHEFSEGLAAVSVYDPIRSERDHTDRYLWGFIDTSGHLVIDCTYLCVSYFSEGLAQVWTEEDSGFINPQGELVFSGPWLIDHTENGFQDGLCRVCIDGGEGGLLHGLIDRAGNTVIPCEWEDLTYFYDGLALCRKNGLYGFIDRAGELAVPCQYDDAGIFFEGLAMVSKDGKCGFIDPTGAEVIPLTWDRAGDFSEGMALVMKDRRVSYIDQNGNVVFTLPWENSFFGLSFYSFSDGLALVYDPETKLYGYVDHTGALAIPCEFFVAYPFSQGRALVRKSRLNAYQLIDTAGQVVTPFEFFSSNIAFNELYLLCRSADQSGYGFMDTDGNFVVPCEYEPGSHYSDGYFTLIRDGNLTIMDEEGNILYQQHHSIEYYPKGNDLHVNANNYLSRSRELAATYYPVFDLSEYKEAISYNDQYVVVYYRLPILATGGGGPSFFYDRKTDELLFSYAQY